MRKIFLSFCLLMTFCVFGKENGCLPKVEKEIPQPCQEAKRQPFSIWGEFSAWHAVEGGLGFVYDESMPLEPGKGVSGDLIRGNFDWHGAFRVCFGYDISDYWKVEAQYANFNPVDTQRVNRHVGDELHATFPHDETLDINTAKSYISLTSHFADILMKRKWHAASHIDLSLIGGFSATWMKQAWQVHYLDDFTDRCFKPKLHFKGGGPKIGTLVDWLLPYGLGLEFQGCFAALYGNFDNRVWAHDTDRETQELTILANTHYDDFRVVTTWQLRIGPYWEKKFEHFSMKILAAFEINTWYNLIEIDRQIFYEGEPHTYALPYQLPSTLAFQGVTFGLYFDL